MDDDYVFVLFNSLEHLKRFQSYLNSPHFNISFTIENEKDNRMFFLDARQGEQDKFTTSTYRKPTFSGICAHFDSFLPSIYDVVMIHALLYRCFQICSDWTKFHLELVKLMDVFNSNGYPENFIYSCFKTFLDNKHRKQEKVINAPRKPLFLVLPYLGPLSLQTKNK